MLHAISLPMPISGHLDLELDLFLVFFLVRTDRVVQGRTRMETRSRLAADASCKHGLLRMRDSETRLLLLLLLS